MAIEQISSRKIGKEANCSFCQAGSTISFNWQYALKKSKSDLPKNKDLYINPIELKKGTLFQCKSCGSHWYLDSDDQFMNHVKDEKLKIISLWSNSEQKLSIEQSEELRIIGSTPPDLYGNGSKFEQTPCQIKTKDGEIFECAIVSVQEHAPFEDWRTYRLASEIDEISPSPYALPLEVRLATTQADEIRMGFAPTLVELSNGKRMILNWTTNFLKVAGVEAPATKVCSERVSTSNMPEIYQANEKTVYFIADPPIQKEKASKKPSLLRKLKRLFGAH
jgi:hypothetical protein